MFIVIDIVTFFILTSLLITEVYMVFHHRTIMPLFPLMVRLYVMLFTSVLWTWILEITAKEIIGQFKKNTRGQHGTSQTKIAAR
jgi:hypothetical protein